MIETGRPAADAIGAIHLDTVGGIAGDMFVAAMLDALPSLWPICERAIIAMAPPVGITAHIAAHTDGVLTGSQFRVTGAETAQGEAPADAPDNAHHHPHDHEHSHSHHHSHGHSHDHSHESATGHGHQHGHSHHHHGASSHHAWRAIRERLQTSGLDSTVAETAVAIFTLLAKAEASVHGIAPDDVTFHEVGAWDSIIDIVAAAALIAALPGCKWTVGSLPRGRGLVKTAHGMLPVPAPATVELLRGFAVHDDNEMGERITPTGAAIIAYLQPDQSPDLTPRRMLASGTGFGTKRLKHRSNIVRAMFLGKAETIATGTTETLAQGLAMPGESGATTQDMVEVLRCEIDDQTAEDLAIAIDHLRGADGVLDVCQWPVFAKKGRIATALQVLTCSGAGDNIARLILDETTTLGVRRSIARRDVVHRTLHHFEETQVKLARRPSSTTAKAEADAVAAFTTHAARQAARGAAEQQAIGSPRPNGQDSSENDGTA